MKTLWKIFAALGAADIVLVLWLCQVAGGMPLSALFYDAFVLTKMIELLLLLGLVLVAVLPNGKGQMGGFLKVALWLLLGLGALGSLQSLSSTWQAMQGTGVSRLQVIAPSLAEGLVPVGLGLLIAALAAWKIASSKPRPAAANFD
jgi:hypothetical protein